MGRNLLCLNYDDFSSKVNDAFTSLNDAIRSDENFSNSFVGNPFGVFSEQVFGFGAKSQQKISSANRFIFSVLSNEPFLEWLLEYQNTLVGSLQNNPNSVNKKTIMQDFAGAFVQFGSKELIYSVLELTMPNNNQMPNQSAFLDVNMPPLPGPPVDDKKDDGDDADDIAVAIILLAVIVIIIVIAPVEMRTHNNGLYGSPLLTSNDIINIAEQLTQKANQLNAEGKLLNIFDNFTEG